MKNKLYSCKDFSFSYSGSNECALSHISFTIDEGEFIVVCGKSGCGKTTLLRHLKPSLWGNGRRSGQISFCGVPCEEVSEEEHTRRIGFIFQNCESQFVTDQVWHELAFGLESLGCSSSEIRRRVAEMASYFGLQQIYEQPVEKLSGGQKQLVNLAAIMVMQPEVIILDEPVSQLDPISATEFILMLQRINREFGTTIVITEHRLEELFSICNRIILMDHSHIAYDGSLQGLHTFTKQKEEYLSILPVSMQIYNALNEEGTVPLNLTEGRRWLSSYVEGMDVIACSNRMRQTQPSICSTSVVCIESVWFQYNKNERDILKGISLSISKGNIVAILGGNGTGKTTMLSILAGLLKPTQGKVDWEDGIVRVFLPQSPDVLFTHKTVSEELEGDIELARVCKLLHLLERHPFSLSGGEKQRLGLAKVLRANADVILMDEPTKGMDADYKHVFGEMLRELKLQGKTVIMVSHDIEFCAIYAEECAMFFDGVIASMEATHEFFLHNNFYTTYGVRLSRGILEDTVTAGDVVRACGGESELQEVIRETEQEYCNEKENQDHCMEITEEPKIYSSIPWIVFFLVVPLTIYVGMTFLEDRKFYFISLLIMLEAMVPFFVQFERTRKKSRDLVLIAVMCAITVVGRSAFFMIPGIKPVAALVIISGVALGAQTGFIVGALSMLVSNMFFGQGPWTPWQMFAMGMIGFICGALFYKKRYTFSKGYLAIIGGFLTVVVYGGIVNLNSLVVMDDTITKEVILAVYMAGLPFDLLQGVVTSVLLFFLARPIVHEIQRVR